MRHWFVAAAILAVPAAHASAAPLFDGTLTADALAAAPLGITASLAGPDNPMGGGVVTGDVGVIAPGAGSFTIDLRDLGLVGDVYEVILDGMSLGQTSPVPVGGPTNSAGSFSAAIGAGFHDIGVWDFILTFAPGSASPFGGTVVEQLSPTDFALSVDFDGRNAVPEAPTLALLGTALGILGLGGWRRVPASI